MEATPEERSLTFSQDGLTFFRPEQNVPTNTGQVGADGSPHAYAALPEALANGKLQQQ